MEDTDEARRLAGPTERDDVLDLEVDRVADADAVLETLLDDFEPCPLDTEHLADQRRETCHRPTELAAEHGRELLHLLVEVSSSTKIPSRQFPSVITLGVSATMATCDR